MAFALCVYDAFFSYSTLEKERCSKRCVNKNLVFFFFHLDFFTFLLSYLDCVTFITFIQGVFFLMTRFECRRMSRLIKISTCGLLYRLEDMREFCLMYDTFMCD